MFKTLLVNGQKTNLYYHRTDGGAEYLYDTFIECENGHKEGTITNETNVLIRIDGEELEIYRLA